jgi:hypothetical protein
MCNIDQIYGLNWKRKSKTLKYTIWSFVFMTNSSIIGNGIYQSPLLKKLSKRIHTKTWIKKPFYAISRGILSPPNANFWRLLCFWVKNYLAWNWQHVGCVLRPNIQFSNKVSQIKILIWYSFGNQKSYRVFLVLGLYWWISLHDQLVARLVVKENFYLEGHQVIYLV